MHRHNKTIQINVRITEALLRKLVIAAEKHGVNFSQEIKARLNYSFENNTPEMEKSLASALRIANG